MWRRYWITCLLVISCVSGIFSVAQAQDSSASDQPIPAASKEGASADSEPKTIYIPFSDLNQAFGKPDASVVIPRDEYRKLLEALRQGTNARIAPAAVIREADYKVHVDGDMARIAAHFKIHVLRQGWTEVPVQFGPATIGSMKSAENVLLRGLEDGKNGLLFPKAGDYDVELQLACRIQQSPDAREISFSCPMVSLTSLQVTVPGEGQKIEFVPAGINVSAAHSESKKSEGDQKVTQASANIGATSKITIRWSPSESQVPTMNLLASVNNRTLITLGDGLIHTEAFLSYDILRGELTQTRIVLPKAARLLDVFAEKETAAWTAAVEGDNQVVTVTLPHPVKQKLQLTVRSETPLSESEFSVAGISPEKTAMGIHALDAVREGGQIAVRHSNDLMVNVLEQQGLIRIENGDADPKLTGANALLFKFYSPQILLRLNARPVEPRLQVDHQIELLFRETELQFVNRLSYLVERAGVFELTYQLPEGALIDQVSSPQMKEFSLDSATRKLTVSLRERTQGRIDVQIRGHLPLAESGQNDVKLPLLEPLQVDREQGSVQVFSPEAMEVQAASTGLESAQPEPIGPEIRNGNLQLASAWTFTRRPVVIPVHVLHKPTRLQATLGTVVQLEPELAHVSSTLTYQIEYAPVDEFRMEIPEMVSSRVQIEIPPGDTTSAPIKQRTQAPPQNGLVVWTIQTQRKVAGQQTFLITYDQIPTSSETTASSSTTNSTASSANAETAPSAHSGQNYEFHPIRPLGSLNADGKETAPVVEFRGEITLKKDRTLAMTANTTGNGIEQVDVRELKLLPTDGTLAFRYFRDDAENPVALNVKTGRFDLQDVVATAVSRGLVEIVASEDQSVTYRCRYRVKSTERQRLLVFLPKDLEVLGAFLNDREVKLEKADIKPPAGLSDALVPFWVNVARPESSETPFLFTFQFLWNLKSGTTSHLLQESLLHLPLPVIGQENRGVVQELKVVIWMPREYALVGDPDPFLLAKRDRTCSFIRGMPANHSTAGLEEWVTAGETRATGFAELPTEGRKAFIFSTLGGPSEITTRVWNKTWMTVLISVALALIGWILLGTSWENKLGILLLMAFIAVMYGLFDSHGLAQGIHAARYGLAFVLIMWFIRCLSHPFRPAPSVKPPEYCSTEIPYAVIPPPGVFDRLQPGSEGTPAL